MKQSGAPITSPERWRRAKEVFFRAVECEASERAALVAEQCADDEALRAEVESLLAAHQALSRSETRSEGSPPLLTFAGNERFSLETEIGAGGFGVVYRAFDRKLGQRVALKVLRNVQSESLLQFKREFRAIAQLRLVNLVRCYELFSEGRLLFFTMELIQGLPILDHLRRCRESLPAAVDAIRRTFTQLCNGVLALHEAGWLHRDLKPSNVLVDDAGRVVVLDLGLARSVQDSHHSSRLFGSLDYLAPELFAQAAATAASDWYSVGVMLYEALTGRLPWRSSGLELMLEKTSGNPPGPRSLVPEIPETLDTLCSALLRRDPSERPGGMEIVRRLAGETASLAPPDTPKQPPSPTSFVGRAEHLSALQDALADCVAGRPSVVEVAGPSGMGKTALVQHFLSGVRAEVKGSVIFEGRCYEHESIGFKLFDGVVDALALYLRGLPSGRVEALLPRNLGELVQVFPALLQVTAIARARRRVFAAQAPDAVELRRKAFDAFEEMLGRIADEHPLVVFVDDVQWSDRDSLAPLQRILTSESTPPLLFIATYRTELSDNPVLADLRQVLAGAKAKRCTIELGRLRPDEARAFAESLLGDRHPALAAIVEEAGGIPYFLDELVGHARREMAGEEGSARRQLRLDDLLLERIGRLPTGARRLLEVLSLARQPLSIATARAAADDDAGPSDALAVLYTSRLARPFGDGSWVEPHHDRIREVVEAAMSTESCTGVHGRLGAALEAHGGDAEQMAVHFQAAGDDERALRYTILAAQRAAAQAAFNRAARLYERAIALAGDRSTAALYQESGDAHADAGLGRKAADSYDAAAALDPTNAHELRRKAAEQLLRIGEIDAGLSMMSQELGTVPWRRAESFATMAAGIAWRGGLLRLRGLSFRPRDERDIPRALVLRTDLAWTAFLGLFVDPVRAAYIQSYHILDALKAGEPSRVVRALAAEAALTGLRGTETRYRRLMRALDQACERVSDKSELHWPTFARTIAAFGLGQWGECRREAAAAESAFMAKGKGASWELSIVRALSLAATMLAGELRESQRRLQQQLRDCEERGDRFAPACLALLGSSHLLRLMQDEPEVAQRELRDLRQHWPAARFPILDYNAGYGLAQVALYLGHLDEAWAFFSQERSAASRVLLHASPVIRIFYRHLHARAAIARARQAPARSRSLLRMAAADARALLGEGNTGAAGLAHLISAGLASQRGDPSVALQALALAERDLEAGGMRPLSMTARLARGHLTPGANGALLVRDGESWAARQEVRRPDRMIAVFIPGVL